MKARPEKAIEYCYICGNVARELDHFPVPDCAGGTEQRPICRGCHDEKDRTLLLDWNASEAIRGLTGLWAKADVRERLVLAKMISITGHAVHAARSTSR